MKYLALFLLTLLIISCQFIHDNKKNIVLTLNKTMIDSITRPTNFTAEAKLVNIGFIDSPVYVWIEALGCYEDNNKTFPYILGVKYSYVNESKVDTVYYEYENGRKTLSNVFINNKFKIILYPGDATLKISYKDQELIVFTVFAENQRFENGKNWIRVPTTSLNKNNEMVSDDGMDISFEKTNENTYILHLIGKKGISHLEFKKHGNFSIQEKITYLDKVNGVLYYLSKDCYLELINKSDLDKL